MNTCGEKEIKALITLLSEEAPKNLVIIKDKILKMKESALPFLREALTSGSSKIQKEIYSILEEIRLKELTERWISYASCKKELDLEEGAFLYASYEEPDLNVHKYQNMLDHWAEELLKILNLNSSVKDRFQAAHHYYFQILGFNGNHINYYDPLNSYLPNVMETKKGLPITLSVVLILIGKRLNLPFYPVGMPGHFILKYDDGLKETFIDPFNGGQILSKQDCINYLIQSGYGYREEYLFQTGNRAILERMMNNLVTVYSQLKNKEAASFVTKMIEILHRP